MEINPWMDLSWGLALAWIAINHHFVGRKNRFAYLGLCVGEVVFLVTGFMIGSWSMIGFCILYMIIYINNFYKWR